MTGEDTAAAPKTPPSPPHRVIRGRRVVTPGGVRPAAVHIARGVIESVREYDDIAHDAPGDPNARGAAAVSVIDVGDAVLLPGLVDTHVHLNEPGRAEWEGFESGTLAAAAGGITTLVDMPLNSVPPTTTRDALERKRAAARDRCRADVGFWGGVVPDNAAELEDLVEGGVLGFKCFLVDSGVAEFPPVGEAELRLALPILAEAGLPLLVHAELPGPLSAATPPAGADPRRYATWLATRPDAAEVEAVELLVRLCRETGARIHVVHVASADALAPLRAAREEGLPLSAETCPHYLTFAAEEIPDGATSFKCAPPVRERRHREELWAALASGELELIASDHSPSPPDRKLLDEGDFLRAWGGIASLQVALAAVWTGARARGHGLEAVARWMGAAPARLAGMDGRKGAIAPGCDADLVVFQPDAEWTVEGERLHHRHPLTAYHGRTLAGRVEATYLGGERIIERGEPRGPARGRLLAPEGATWTSPS